MQPINLKFEGETPRDIDHHACTAETVNFAVGSSDRDVLG